MGVVGGCCEENRPVRDMSVPEEIRALKEYNVPDSVIERILRKIEEGEEQEQLRLKYRDRIIQDLQESDKNNRAVINALGAYLAIQEARVREV